MPIKPVKADSPVYRDVLAIWRTNSDFLGFMPDGGFADAMRAGCLLAEVDRDGTVHGYVMFRRTSRGTVAIVHLCVAPGSRGKGIARKLFHAVRSRCADAYEIHARCRRDFEANGMWPHLDFVAAGDAQGKAGMLTIWRYQIAPLPLFALLAGLSAPTTDLYSQGTRVDAA